jgi:hypothetical protein
LHYSSIAIGLKQRWRTGRGKGMEDELRREVTTEKITGINETKTDKKNPNFSERLFKSVKKELVISGSVLLGV